MGICEAAWIGENMANQKLSCEQVVQQFFAYLDRALGGESMEALESHLKACLDCCDKLEFSRKLDAVVRDRLEKGALPEGIEERIRRVLAQ